MWGVHVGQKLGALRRGWRPTRRRQRVGMAVWCGMEAALGLSWWPCDHRGRFLLLGRRNVLPAAEVLERGSRPGRTAGC